MNLPTPPKISAAKTGYHLAALASLLISLSAFSVILFRMTYPRLPTLVPLALQPLLRGATNMVWLLIPGAIVLAIVALCGISRHGRRGIWAYSISSLGLNSLLLMLFALGYFLRHQSPAEPNRSASITLSVPLPHGGATNIVGTNYSQVRQIADAIQASYRPPPRPDPIPQSPSYNTSGQNLHPVTPITRPQPNPALALAAQNSAREDAAVRRIMNDYQKLAEDAGRKYATAGTKLQQLKIPQGKSLPAKSAIASQRAVVRDFLTANDELKRILTEAEKTLRAELASAEISQTNIDSAIKGFKAGVQSRNANDLQIRDCDKQIGEALLEILDLFEEHWGKWQFDTRVNQVIFQNSKAQDTYSRHLQQIINLSDTQARLSRNALSR